MSAPDAYTLTSGPSSEPITTAEAKLHMRVDTSADDDLIDDYIPAAREMLEDWLDIAFFTQTWVLKMSEFPLDNQDIIINKTPLQSVSSITYINSGGTGTSWSSSNYVVDILSKPGRIRPAYNESYPSHRGDIHGIVITFVAGFSTVGSIPLNWKQTAYMLTGDLYNQREAGSDIAFTYKENPTYKRFANSIRTRPFIGAA